MATALVVTIILLGSLRMAAHAATIPMITVDNQIGPEATGALQQAIAEWDASPKRLANLVYAYGGQPDCQNLAAPAGTAVVCLDQVPAGDAALTTFDSPGGWSLLIGPVGWSADHLHVFCHELSHIAGGEWDGVYGVPASGCGLPTLHGSDLP